LPLAHVSETMRPLPIDVILGLPKPVSGVAIIRGVPTPVVDAAWLLAGEASLPTRFVTVKVGGRHVALAVEDVIGIRTIPSDAIDALPPLLTDASSAAIAAIGRLDSQLLVVLQSARLVPESAWSAIEEAWTST
jgi:purine-binding chemotaxis protein CheW